MKWHPQEGFGDPELEQYVRSTYQEPWLQNKSKGLMRTCSRMFQKMVMVIVAFSFLLFFHFHLYELLPLLLPQVYVDYCKEVGGKPMSLQQFFEQPFHSQPLDCVAIIFSYIFILIFIYFPFLNLCLGQSGSLTEWLWFDLIISQAGLLEVQYAGA